MGVHTRPTCASVRATARACAMGRRRIRADTCERLPVGVDRGWLGAQAFYSASAFNANIGAWNTAAVTTLSGVGAAFSARAARHRGRPRVRYSCAQERWDVCTDVHIYTYIVIVCVYSCGR